MSNLVSFATPRRQARSNLTAGWLAGGRVEIYTAPKPASADTAITTQVRLVDAVLPDPAGTATDGIFSGDLPPPTVILADGIAAWGRLKDATGDTVFDLDAGLDGSGSGIEVDNVEMVQGATATFLSITIAEG